MHLDIIVTEPFGSGCFLIVTNRGECCRVRQKRGGFWRVGGGGVSCSSKGTISSSLLVMVWDWSWMDVSFRIVELLAVSSIGSLSLS